MDEEQRSTIYEKLSLMKCQYPEKIFPDNLELLTLAQLKVLFDQFLQEIDDEIELDNIRIVYVTFVIKLQQMYSSILNAKLIIEIDDIFKFNKREVYTSIRTLFAEFKQLVDNVPSHVDFNNEINQVDSNINSIIKFIIFRNESTKP